jgi:phosphotransferase system enzyme I (PtsI)
MLLNGIGAAPGVAVGRIYLYQKTTNIPKEKFISAGEEQSHLDIYFSVKKQAIDKLEQIRLSMQDSDPKKAEIFKAHQDIVDDIVINEEIPARIINDHWSGDWAIFQVYETVLALLRKTPDPHIAERAADFEDVRSLLLKFWYGQNDEAFFVLDEPVIIAAQELMPSDTASLDKSKVLAILTEKGGLTSHTAIIAKSYGIPTIMGIQGLLNIVKHGQIAAVNAGEGTVILDPEEIVTGDYLEKRDEMRLGREETEKYLYTEGCTADGVKIDIGLNIANENDGEQEAAYIDSVGVFRTEYLYMGSKTLPTEDQQISAYRKVLERFKERPVILRTLDIGGDKPLLSLELPREENPFLGNRALRFCFLNPDIFKTQIRACLRAAVYGNLWLMLPMVGSLDDIYRAKEFIAGVKYELENEGVPFGEIKFGIMIEIPSIALVSDIAAQEVDFASIGSNDLCQYLCAADRMNTNVKSYYQSYHPAMFRLIKETVKAFSDAKKPVSICGELGSDVLAVPVLIGLGLRKLSMNAASVASVKRTIASISIEKAKETAEKVLSFHTAAEIEEYLKGTC